MYDIYLSMGCRILPDFKDLLQEASILTDPAVITQILQRSPGPGFLGLDLNRQVAGTLLQLLKSTKASGYIVDAAYRKPSITIEQATAIAEHAITELQATRFSDTTFNPIHFEREQPVCWTFCAVSEQWVKKGLIPGALYVSVDKLDGHVWQPEEFDRLRGEA